MYIYISTEYWPEHSFKILSYTFDLLIGYFHVYSLSKFQIYASANQTHGLIHP